MSSAAVGGDYRPGSSFTADPPEGSAAFEAVISGPGDQSAATRKIVDPDQREYGFVARSSVTSELSKEAAMPEQSSMHSYLSWTKERIDEMDATLASLESGIGQLKADTRTTADQLIADIKKCRDNFQAVAKAKAAAGEAAWEAARTQLESQWDGFEAQVKTYLEGVGKQVGQQQATFSDVAAAQAKAWQESIDKLHGQAQQVAAAGRAEVESSIERMKADAAAAEARLEKLKQAGTESWKALSTALAESRKAFDRANQQAWDAAKRAASTRS